MVVTIDDLFRRLSRSSFRQRFHLGNAEYQYCLKKGEVQIRQHAAEFIKARLAPAIPANDGKQTPMRGHPVFIAQHATATCCRGCLSKWHNIPPLQPMTEDQQAWVVEVLLHWIHQEMQRPQPAEKQRKTSSKAKPDQNQQLDLL
ncbi:DUF4186 domain-containing protein [Erwinia endophytica]|uniref:DUF4186 domain-containing protein n=1 Tax=Erwinia endophytica TaxID=1563158 RepID=UPI0012660316|nr:DUF4186 domain-containing protein [Erwinia endophytica]